MRERERERERVRDEDEAAVNERFAMLRPMLRVEANGRSSPTLTVTAIESLMRVYASIQSVLLLFLYNSFERIMWCGMVRE